MKVTDHNRIRLSAEESREVESEVMSLGCFYTDSFEAATRTPLNPLIEAFRTLQFTFVDEPVWHRMVDLDEVRRALAVLMPRIRSGEVDPNAPLPVGFEFCASAMSPLAAAARMGQAELFALLHEVKEVDPCCVDSSGESVLMHAVHGAFRKGSTAVLQIALQDPRVIDKINHSAVDRDGMVYTALDVVFSPENVGISNELKYEVADLLKNHEAIAMRYEES